jgi:hypothetical protein
MRHLLEPKGQICSSLWNSYEIPQLELTYLQESHRPFTTGEGPFGELQYARGVFMASPRKR